jgi:hypothetical protein
MRIKINTNINWHDTFFLEGLALNPKRGERKEEGKEKKLIGAQPLLRNAHAPGHQKRTTWCFQCCCSRRCLIFERHRTLHPKKEGTSHSLSFVMHTPTTFIFLIIFIFVKRMNCPLFKLIITKKTMMKIQKISWMLILSFCF